MLLHWNVSHSPLHDLYNSYLLHHLNHHFHDLNKWWALNNPLNDRTWIWTGKNSLRKIFYVYSFKLERIIIKLCCRMISPARFYMANPNPNRFAIIMGAKLGFLRNTFWKKIVPEKALKYFLARKRFWNFWETNTRGGSRGGGVLEGKANIAGDKFPDCRFW